ncbi:MAG: hypothetical protein SGPRY_013266, partial [Prymnesium sp.]
KLEDLTFSPNLALHLVPTLRALQCTHPAGTYANSFAGASVGKWQPKASQHWMFELCDLLANLLLLPAVVKGGPSFQLGKDDHNDNEFTAQTLGWRGMQRLDVTVTRDAEAMSLAFVENDAVLLALSSLDGAGSGGYELLYPIEHASSVCGLGRPMLHTLGFDSAFMHTSSAAVQNDHEAPQTEVALRNSPNKLL